jgi:ankyrin repeat protein
VFVLQHGITPLMIAVKESRTAIVDKLLELGANPNEQCKVFFFI